MLYLAESLAALESAPTLSAAVLAGLTCVAAHLHAPVGAILEGNDVLAVVGLESSRVHPAWWHAPAGSDIDWQREPGDGIGPIIVVPIPSDPPRRMVLAHPDRDAADGTGFGPSEVRVAQCLADILAGSFARLTERVRQMETEHRLRQIIETVGQAVWVFDADGRTSYANDKMAEILGYGLDQLAGLTLFDVSTKRARHKRQETWSDGDWGRPISWNAASSGPTGPAPGFSCRPARCTVPTASTPVRCASSPT